MKITLFGDPYHYGFGINTESYSIIYPFSIGIPTWMFHSIVILLVALAVYLFSKKSIWCRILAILVAHYIFACLLLI